jgi:ketosteroid isomerase-like protein
VFAWLEDRDVDSFLAALHPDIAAHPSIGGRALRGRAAVAQWFGEFAEPEGSLEARPLEFEQRGECVIVRGYLRHRAGRALAESQVYWVCEIHDGQIVRMESHSSRLGAIRAC